MQLATMFSVILPRRCRSYCRRKDLTIFFQENGYHESKTHTRCSTRISLHPRVWPVAPFVAFEVPRKFSATRISLHPRVWPESRWDKHEFRDVHGFAPFSSCTKTKFFEAVLRVQRSSTTGKDTGTASCNCASPLTQTAAGNGASNRINRNSGKSGMNHLRVSNAAGLRRNFGSHFDGDGRWSWALFDNQTNIERKATHYQCMVAPVVTHHELLVAKIPTAPWPETRNHSPHL